MNECLGNASTNQQLHQLQHASVLLPDKWNLVKDGGQTRRPNSLSWPSNLQTSTKIQVKRKQNACGSFPQTYCCGLEDLELWRRNPQLLACNIIKPLFHPYHIGPVKARPFADCMDPKWYQYLKTKTWRQRDMCSMCKESTSLEAWVILGVARS